MSGLRTQSAAVMVVLAALSPLLAGCDQPTEAAAGTQPSLPDVSIVTVKPQPRAMVRELPGRIAPTRVSEVRPRVSGIVVERMFRQGSEVKAGDPLYRIDPRPFEVEVQSSKAALARAEAVHVQAAQQARRISLLTNQRTSKAARPTLRAPISTWTTRPSARRSTASSAPPRSAKARSWCSTIQRHLRPSSNWIRSTPISPNRSAK